MVDDHPIVREGMAQFLNLQHDLELCCEAGDADAALSAMSACHHDLVIVDISLGKTSGLGLIHTLRNRYPRLAILAMSMHDERIFAPRAMKAGANGYLMKHEATANILLAINQVISGENFFSADVRDLTDRTPIDNPDLSLIASLSEREFEILHLLGLGYGTRQIAQHVNRSIKTIESHMANLKEKLQMESSRDLMRFAVLYLDKS